jgi:hypothetical protein
MALVDRGGKQIILLNCSEKKYLPQAPRSVGTVQAVDHGYNNPFVPEFRNRLRFTRLFR